VRINIFLRAHRRINRIIKEHNIRKYFLSLDRQQDPEILDIVSYFKKNKFSIFPYEFQKTYHAKDITVYEDEYSKMSYVIHKNKKMYFPRYMERSKIRNYYNGILKEQDNDSPHRYETKGFTVKNGDIIADIGAAEGVWALENVEKAAQVFLFECENRWIQALQKTFEPWKEKVVIVNKYISNITEGDKTTLDDFLQGNRINFIKADIEGMETLLLEGAKETLSKQNDIKLLLCSYHKQNDEKDIKNFFNEYGFFTQNSKGYMLFILDESLKAPYLRRGLIRASKQSPSHDSKKENAN